MQSQLPSLSYTNLLDRGSISQNVSAERMIQLEQENKSLNLLCSALKRDIEALRKFIRMNFE
jgi:gluconate kinase